MDPPRNRSDSCDMSVCSDVAVYSPTGVRNERKNLVELEAKRRLAQERFEWDVKMRKIEMRTEAMIASRLQKRKEATIATITPSAFKLPTRQRELPTTREGFHALSNEIKANGGPHIGVYAGCSVVNIRKNFIKRLNLVGKY